MRDCAAFQGCCCRVAQRQQQQRHLTPRYISIDRPTECKTMENARYSIRSDRRVPFSGSCRLILLVRTHLLRWTFDTRTTVGDNFHRDRLSASWLSLYSCPSKGATFLSLNLAASSLCLSLSLFLSVCALLFPLRHVRKRRPRLGEREDLLLHLLCTIRYVERGLDELEPFLGDRPTAVSFSGHISKPRRMTNKYVQSLSQRFACRIIERSSRSHYFLSVCGSV